MKATLKNYRQAPRKVRLVAAVVKGKRVDKALTLLSFLPKKAALSVKKLILSATANAKQGSGLERDALKIKNITVDKGFVFKRYRARARGRSAPIRKRTSHITVVLAEQERQKSEARNPKS